MAKYRQVHCDFWRDAFVMKLTPEEKFFYLYIMTNPASRQCGIYELPIQIMAMETGYNQETVLKLIKIFVEYDKIRFDFETSEIAIKNWYRYNSNSSPKVLKLIESELNCIKNQKLISYVYGMHTVWEAYRNKNKNNNRIEEEIEEEINAGGTYDSLISNSLKIFSEQNREGVFFEKMKKLHGLNDQEISEAFQQWQNKKIALSEEFKTEKHLKASFNKHLEIYKPENKKESAEDVFKLLEERNQRKYAS